MWVDGSDREWLKEKNKYSEEKTNIDDAINRYRDIGTLKYWFRGVEKYTPWVNKIHFVTWGHIPDWLNVDNPKLNIVNHKDFIPEKYLPTFSANPIELNLHRIKGLAEQFVLFNDDMFILNELSPEYFFKDNLPCDYWKENPFETEKEGSNFFDHIILNDLFVINKNFDKREVIKKNLGKVFNVKYGRSNVRFLMLNRWKYFTGFICPHTANPYLKSSYKDIWDKEYEILDNACSHKFRHILDVNQWVINWWQMCQGNFSVKSNKNVGKYFTLKNYEGDLKDYILSDDSTIVCINDTDKDIDFEKAKKGIIEIFEKKLSEKSSFEK